MNESFFRDPIYDYVMGLKDGPTFMSLYQYLCFLTLNSDGMLCTQVADMLIPWDCEKIQAKCMYYDLNTVRVAIDLFRKVGLLYEMPDGILKLQFFDNMVGSETKDAERKRQSRASKKETDFYCDPMDEAELKTETVAKAEPKAETVAEPQAKPVVKEEAKATSSDKENSNAVTVKTNISGKTVPGGYFSKSLKACYKEFEGQLKHLSTDNDLRELALRKFGSYHFGTDYSKRLLLIAREISRHEGYRINGSFVKSEDIINTFWAFFRYNGSDMVEAFNRIDTAKAGGLIVNLLLYSITFLYNAAVLLG